MITKERSEWVPDQEEAVVFNCLVPGSHGSPPHIPQDFTFVWPGYSRHYERCTESGQGRRAWHNFEHFRSEQGDAAPNLLPVYTEKWGTNPHFFKGYVKNPSAGYHVYWYGSELAPYGSPGSLNSGLPTWHVTLPDGHFVPEPVNLDAMVSDSLRVMMPGIKAELSLINSIIELKDFKGIARVIGKGVSRVNNLVPLFRRIVKGAKSPKTWTLSNLSRETAGKFLGWEFAVKPLLSDISAIMRVISRTEKRINDLVTRAGRVQKRHYTFVWREYPDKSEATTNPGYVYHTSELRSTGMYGQRRQVFYEPTKFHAEIEFSYYLTQYQREHARVLGLLDAFGVNYNPAIIWNAIPFTFIVDWVAGVSRWLETMKTSHMEPMVNVRRYLWSVKRERRIYVTRGIERSYYGLPPEQWLPLPVIKETAYRRQVGIPSWSSFMTSGLSSRELILGAALIVARRRRYHRRYRSA